MGRKYETVLLGDIFGSSGKAEACGGLGLEMRVTFELLKILQGRTFTIHEIRLPTTAVQKLPGVVTPPPKGVIVWSEPWWSRLRCWLYR